MDTRVKLMHKKEKAYKNKLSTLLLVLLCTACSPLSLLQAVTPAQAPAQQEHQISYWQWFYGCNPTFS